MKVLVVGSTSVIGRAIASRLAATEEVKMAGRREADIFLDLTQWDKPAVVKETFDIVVHAAASFGGDADADIIRTELVNATGTLSVCALAQRTGAKHVVLISSVSASYQAQDPHYGIYALSKRHGEEAAQLFCAARGLTLTILRPTQVYDAAGACSRHQPLLYAMATRAQAGEDICLYGSHDALRNYIFLDDLAEVCYRAAKERCEGTFACGNPENVRLSDVATAAHAAFGRGGTVRFDATKVDVADLPLVTDFALYEHIGYTPTTTIREGIARIRDYREANT